MSPELGIQKPNREHVQHQCSKTANAFANERTPLDAKGDGFSERGEAGDVKKTEDNI